MIAIVFVLRTMAYATPPDPDWIAGFWDDDDHDDVVVLITSTSSIFDADPVVDVRPAQFVVASVPTDDDPAIPVPPDLPHQSRAPPLG